VLGDDNFAEEALKKAEQLEKKTLTMDEIIEKVTRVYGMTEEELAARGNSRRTSEARGLIALLVRENGGLSLRDFAIRMNRDASSLSHAAERVLIRSKANFVFGKWKQKLEKALSQ